MSNAIDRALAPAQSFAANISQTTAVEVARAVAEVQAAIIVAQQNPRDIVRVWAEMRASCSRLALAERAFYRVSNRGTGPSVHLARELIRIWGNCDYGVKELRRDDGRGESEILTYAWDQQTNVRPTRSLIVPHARMKKVDGRQTREQLIDLTDVYLNNQNIGARAVRECIFSVLPKDFTAEAEELCHETLKKGDGKPLDRRIADLVVAFGQLGVKVAQIEAKVGRGRGQWNAADLADLAITFSSIKRGEVRAEEEFAAGGVSIGELTSRPAPTPAPELATEPAGDPWDGVEVAQPAVEQ